MELGRGCPVPALGDGCLPSCLQGWGTLGSASWSGNMGVGISPGGTQRGGWGRHGGTARWCWRQRGQARLGKWGGEKPLLRASTPPRYGCYQGQQAVNQARVPFYHLSCPGRAVPFPTASAKPGTGCPLVAGRWKMVNLYSFPARYDIRIYLCCGWERRLMHHSSICADTVDWGRTVPCTWRSAGGKAFISLCKRR